MTGAWQFIQAHEGVIGLLILAFIATMPDELPASLGPRSLIFWSYAWLHSGLKAYVSFRVPSAPPKNNQPGPDGQKVTQ